MKTPAQLSAEFVHGFADLAERLSEIGICIHTLQIHWGSFGHWTLIATKQNIAVRFDYDGRDSFIRVKVSPIREHCHPNEWEEVIVKGIENNNGEAIDFVESHLRERFLPK